MGTTICIGGAVGGIYVLASADGSRHSRMVQASARFCTQIMNTSNPEQRRRGAFQGTRSRPFCSAAAVGNFQRLSFRWVIDGHSQTFSRTTVQVEPEEEEKEEARQQAICWSILFMLTLLGSRRKRV